VRCTTLYLVKRSLPIYASIGFSAMRRCTMLCVLECTYAYIPTRVSFTSGRCGAIFLASILASIPPHPEKPYRGCSMHIPSCTLHRHTALRTSISVAPLRRVHHLRHPCPTVFPLPTAPHELSCTNSALPRYL
jgi:hypothetical protein